MLDLIFGNVILKYFKSVISIFYEFVNQEKLIFILETQYWNNIEHSTYGNWKFKVL